MQINEVNFHDEWELEFAKAITTAPLCNYVEVFIKCLADCFTRGKVELINVAIQSLPPNMETEEVKKISSFFHDHVPDRKPYRDSWTRSGKLFAECGNFESAVLAFDLGKKEPMQTACELQNRSFAIYLIDNHPERQLKTKLISALFNSCIKGAPEESLNFYCSIFKEHKIIRDDLLKTANTLIYLCTSFSTYNIALKLLKFGLVSQTMNHHDLSRALNLIIQKCANNPALFSIPCVKEEIEHLLLYGATPACELFLDFADLDIEKNHLLSELAKCIVLRLPKHKLITLGPQLLSVAIEKAWPDVVQTLLARGSPLTEILLKRFFQLLYKFGNRVMINQLDELRQTKSRQYHNILILLCSSKQIHLFPILKIALDCIPPNFPYLYVFDEILKSGCSLSYVNKVPCTSLGLPSSSVKLSIHEALSTLYRNNNLYKERCHSACLTQLPSNGNWLGFLTSEEHAIQELENENMPFFNNLETWVDHEQYSLLHKAICCGYITFSEKLLQKYTHWNISQFNAIGRTPLEDLIQTCPKEAHKILKLLKRQPCRALEYTSSLESQWASAEADEREQIFKTIMELSSLNFDVPPPALLEVQISHSGIPTTPSEFLDVTTDHLNSKLQTLKALCNGEPYSIDFNDKALTITLKQSGQNNVELFINLHQIAAQEWEGILQDLQNKIEKGKHLYDNLKPGNDFFGYAVMRPTTVITPGCFKKVIMHNPLKENRGEIWIFIIHPKKDIKQKNNAFNKQAFNTLESFSIKSQKWNHPNTNKIYYWELEDLVKNFDHDIPNIDPDLLSFGFHYPNLNENLNLYLKEQLPTFYNDISTFAKKLSQESDIFTIASINAYKKSLSLAFNLKYIFINQIEIEFILLEEITILCDYLKQHVKQNPNALKPVDAPSILNHIDIHKCRTQDMESIGNLFSVAVFICLMQFKRNTVEFLEFEEWFWHWLYIQFPENPLDKKQLVYVHEKAQSLKDEITFKQKAIEQKKSLSNPKKRKFNEEYQDFEPVHAAILELNAELETIKKEKKALEIELMQYVKNQSHWVKEINGRWILTPQGILAIYKHFKLVL